MLAGLILEHQGVSLHQTGPVSLIRFINSGPHNLFFALEGRFFRARLWACIIALLICTTFLLQFSSTALIADFGLGLVTVPPQRNVSLVGMSFDNLNTSYMRSINNEGYWDVRFQRFETFAEYRDDTLSEKKTDTTIRDTGITLRSFIPFDTPLERMSIKEFEGISTVLDARVVCIRPKIHDGLGVAITQEFGWTLNGSLIPEVASSGMILSDLPAITQDHRNQSLVVFNNETQNSSEVYLNWSQIIPYAHDAGEWNIVQKIIYQGPTLVSSLDPRYSDIEANSGSNYFLSNPPNYVYTLSYFQRGDPIPLMTGRSYVVMNVSANPNRMTTLIKPTSDNMATGAFFSADQDLNKLVITPQDEWIKFTIPQDPGFHVDISLCYDSFHSVDLLTNITALNSTIEPLLGWNSSKYTFDTELGRRQLGAITVGGRNQASRNIMTINNAPEQLRDQVGKWYNHSRASGFSNMSFPGQNIVSPSLQSSLASGTLLCGACGINFQSKDSWIDVNFPGTLQKQMFQDSLATTADVSMAFQVYYTILGRLAYYDMLPYFDIIDHPSISWRQTAQFPQSFRGLIIVLVVSSVHLLLIIFVTFSFLGTKRTLYVGDNAWQSLTQVYSNQSEQIFLNGTIMRDKEVKNTLEAAGVDNGVLQLGPINEFHISRIGFRKKIL